MIDNVHSGKITNAMGMNALPHPGTPNKPAADASDATLQASFADLINQAIQTPDTEKDAVQKARELLQSGQLTSTENIRSAAENMIVYGI
jgi:hypothetical protein